MPCIVFSSKPDLRQEVYTVASHWKCNYALPHIAKQFASRLTHPKAICKKDSLAACQVNVCRPLNMKHALLGHFGKHARPLASQCSCTSYNTSRSAHVQVLPMACCAPLSMHVRMHCILCIRSMILHMVTLQVAYGRRWGRWGPLFQFLQPDSCLGATFNFA